MSDNIIVTRNIKELIFKLQVKEQKQEDSIVAFSYTMGAFGGMKVEEYKNLNELYKKMTKKEYERLIKEEK